MRRRHFLRSASLGGLALPLVPTLPSVGSQIPRRGVGNDADPFSMHFAAHFGMFSAHAGADVVDQIMFMADQGITALEDNGMKDRSIAEQTRIAQAMAQRDMRMGVFVAHAIYWNEPNLASGRSDWREQFLSEIAASVEVAKRVNATWMTVVPGCLDFRKDMGYQTAHVVESLKQAAALLEPHGLVMVLEPLNPRDHPKLFLSKIAQAYAICKAVDSPACKILDDLYHQQITEGNLIPNIDAAWDEIAYFQIGDNPGRKEPTTGEINYANVFRHVKEKGFTGILGMEHGNATPGRAGEIALLEAYRSVDPG